MRHYKDANNNTFGIEDGDEVPVGLIEISIEEVNAINDSKITSLQKAEQVRAKRNGLIREVDYIMAVDYPMVDKSAYEVYRQELRDITAQTGFPDAIEWPTKPA